MKLIVALLSLLCSNLWAQTKIEKNVPIKAGQRLVLQLDHPNVKIQTGDKPEVMITGTVSINSGEHDSAFGFDVNTTSSEVNVVSSLKDKENIPHRITIKKGDKEYYFKTANFHDPEVQKFLAENGNDYAYRSTGIQVDINLVVTVPHNIPVKVEAKYGIIEVLSYDAALTLDAKYGGIDLTFPPAPKGRITARSRYGEILTNLDTKFDQVPPAGKGSKRGIEITANLGPGPEVVAESKYGNVYLRKSK